MPGDMGGRFEVWRIRTRGWTMLAVQAVAIVGFLYGVYQLLRHSEWIALVFEYPGLIEIGGPVTTWGGLTLATGVVLILTMR